MKKKKKTTKKVITIEQKKQHRAEAEARCSARRTKALEKYGATPEQIEELTTKENARTILCMYYGTYTTNIGEKEITKKKYNKQTKKYEEITVTENVTLRGRQAAEYYIREKSLDVIVFRPTNCFIKTTAEKAEEIANDLRAKIGRCYITKHKRLPAKEAVESLQEKPKKEKKPTYNTSERKKAAKAKRKQNNMKAAAMRPYYAALRKGGISERIKKHNKTLAIKIAAWLDERKAVENKKKEADKEHRASHRQLTSLEMKANKRARKVVKHLAAQERRKEREKKRAESNAKALEKHAKKAQKPVQTELKMAA